MSTVTGTKATPIDADLLILQDSQNAGNLTNASVGSLRIDHVSLTNTVGLLKTFTIWRDAAETSAISTFTLTDGINGTGQSLANYQVDVEYTQWMTAVDDDGFLYRFTSTIAATGVKPQTNGVIHNDWARLNLGGLRVVHDPDLDYAISDIILRDGKLFSPVFAINGTAASVPWSEGYGQGQWYNVATGLFPYHDENETVAVDAIRRVGVGLFQANSNINGATVAVPYVLGTADEQWRVVGSPNDYHRPLNDYLADETVRVGNRFLQANSDITARALVEGSLVNQWRVAGTVLTARIIDANTTDLDARQGDHLYVDTSAGSISIAIDPLTGDFQLTDFGVTWSTANPLLLVLGVDSLVFNENSIACPYKIIRHGNTFRAYGNDGSILVGNVI